jgi:divalent metal cation (Fe/Co/Zn/Cd) transporter
MNPPFAAFRVPQEKRDALSRACRIEWITLGFLASAIVALGVTMGASQTMKAMWVEDTLTLIPSAAFLLGAHYRRKPPDDRFPYGYRRAVLIAYLAGAMTLLGFGLYILGDSAYKLVKAEHPTIQTIRLFGHRVWLGWPMIVALTYGTIPSYFLGKRKLPLALELNDKSLYTSAQINEGDWLSGLAGVAGLFGIAFGYWWADSVAAGFISLEIVRDGYSSLRNSVAQLMNQRPTDVESKQKDPIVDRAQQALEALEWVREARVRLREDGDVLTGEAFVVPSDEADLLVRLEKAARLLHSLDWRLHDVNLVPVRSLG